MPHQTGPRADRWSVNAPHVPARVPGAPDLRRLLLDLGGFARGLADGPGGEAIADHLWNPEQSETKQWYGKDGNERPRAATPA